MARACVVGDGCGRPVVVGHVGHGIQKFVIDVLPGFVLEMLAVP